MPKLPHLPQDHGTLLTLGVVGAIAVVGAVKSRQGSANHLVVGEKVKLSDDALAIFQGRDYRDARGKPYDKSYRAFVKRVVPTGYWVRKPGRPHSDLDYFRDRDLVAADSNTRKWPGTGYQGVKPKGAKNVVRLGDKKEVVLVLQTSGGKHKIEVTQDPKYPQRPYGYTGYTSRKSTSVGSGMGLDDLMADMARKIYYSAALDGINYRIRHDTIGFKDFWVKANGPNAVADAKKNRKTKTKGSRAVSNSLQKRIELANRYIDWAVTNDVRGTGYFGSTWPVVIEYGEPIKLTHGNNRATVRYKEWTGSKSKPYKEVYGLNDEQRVGDLRHEISTYIIKAIKNGAKEEGLKVPAFKSGSRSSTKLSQKLREKINAQMRKKGLDGNGRFRKPDHGYMKAVEIMQDHGVELDEVVSSFQFTARPSGTVKARIAFTNKADLFSPVSIANSMLYLQYTELRKDSFEVVAYLS